MNDTYKVSVIVTVHNSEKYLERCLQSVCNQTLRDIEILCIDGQSFDKSPEILSKFREEDNRVKIINDRNASYGHKINVGIENAMGRYIAILESDDQYDPLMLVKLFGKMKRRFLNIKKTNTIIQQYIIELYFLMIITN